MFGGLAIAIAIGIPFLDSQAASSGGGPTNGPYLLANGTDYLLADGTPMLLA